MRLVTCGLLHSWHSLYKSSKNLHFSFEQGAWENHGKNMGSLLKVAGPADCIRLRPLARQHAF